MRHVKKSRDQLPAVGAGSPSRRRREPLSNYRGPSGRLAGAGVVPGAAGEPQRVVRLDAPASGTPDGTGLAARRGRRV